MAVFRDEITGRLPNSDGLIRNLGTILKAHLQRCADHCGTRAPLDEWDAVNDTVIAAHLLDQVDTVLRSYVHVRIEPEKPKKKGGKA